MKKLLLSTLFVYGFASAANDDLGFEVTYDDLQRQIIESSKRYGELSEERKGPYDENSDQMKIFNYTMKVQEVLEKYLDNPTPETLNEFKEMMYDMSLKANVLGAFSDKVGTDLYNGIVDDIKEYYDYIYKLMSKDLPKGHMDQSEQYFKDLKEGKF